MEIRRVFIHSFIHSKIIMGQKVLSKIWMVKNNGQKSWSIVKNMNGQKYEWSKIHGQNTFFCFLSHERLNPRPTVTPNRRSRRRQNCCDPPTRQTCRRCGCLSPPRAKRPWNRCLGKKWTCFTTWRISLQKTQSKSTNNRTIMANLEMNLPCWRSFFGNTEFQALGDTLTWEFKEML